MRAGRYVILVVLLVYSLTSIAQKTKLSGELSGEYRKHVKEIQIYYNGFLERVKVDPEKFDFDAEFELDEPMFLSFKVGPGLNNYIYGVPGEKLELIIDISNLRYPIINYKKGKIQRLNSYMDLFYSSIEEEGFSTTAYNWYESLFDRPWIAEKAIGRVREAIADNEDFILDFAPNFIDDFNIFADAFMNYIEIERLSLEEIEIILTKIKESDPELRRMSIPFYKQYLIDLSTAYAAKQLDYYDIDYDYIREGHKPKLIAAEALVDNLQNQSITDYLFFDLINNEIMVNGVKNRNYLDFLLDNSGKEIREHFRERYESLVANLAKGDKKEDRVKVIDFEFQDAEGKSYQLDDFKGKLIFIDFWATWCAPCKIQLPHFEDLKELYKGKDIVFMKVSLDADKKSWLEAVAADDHSGYSLHAEGNFRNPFPVHYGVSAIPRFMLIDAEGRMISDDMPKPQNREEVMAIIDADLGSKELEKVIDQHLTAIGAEKLMNGNTYQLRMHQAVFTMVSDIEVYFNYPDNFRQVSTMRKDSSLLMLGLGDDFFSPRFFEITPDTVIGNVPNIIESSKTWYTKSQGLDIFILKKVEQVDFQFAKENSSNTENQYVLEADFNNVNYKFFIDRDDFLLKEIKAKSSNKSRKGGGFIEVSSTYKNYKDVDGMMIPFSASHNNMINVEVDEVVIQPEDEELNATNTLKDL